jgi:hypothetical protein
MQGGAIGVVEPVARVQREKLQLGAFGQIGRLINDESTCSNARLERHEPLVYPGTGRPSNPALSGPSADQDRQVTPTVAAPKEVAVGGANRRRRTLEPWVPRACLAHSRCSWRPSRRVA